VATPAAFATPDDLNTFTGRTIPIAQALMMLEQASALIRSYCGWNLYPSASETLTVDGSGAAVLSLPTLHLSAVTSVTEDDVLLTTDYYEWSAAGFLRRVGASWTTKLRGVVAVVTHGYADPPLEVVAVCLQSASRAIASPAGVKTESSGGVTVAYTIPGGLNDMERTILDRHRVPQSA
jgi:hypothetical protein